MTVPSSTSSVSYDGNGSTQIFSVPFYFLDDTHLVVQTATDGVATTKTLNTDYTVSGAGNEAGGDITMLSAPAVGTKVYIYRQVPLTQLNAYVENTPFPAATQEKALDQLTMAAQQLYLAIQGTLRLSAVSTIDGVSGVLPEPAANEALGWNATVNGFQNISIPDAGTGTYVPGFTGAVASRLIADKLRERISLLDFGAKGDGVTDDTAAVNACLAACALTGATCYVPATAASYRLTSPIVVPDANVSIEGEGAGVVNYPNAAQGAGSWFYFDHTGLGFNSFNSHSYPVRYKGIGTIRNQPTPGVGFTPTANDYDFSTNCDTFFNDVVLLNATKGIKVYTGGRLFVKDLRGQPLSEGINLYETHDTNHIKGVHFWPFWSLDTNVAAYMIAHAKGIILGEADNPILTDIFTIHYWRSISCEALGTDTRGPLAFKLSNFDFDNGATGIYVDSACSGVTGQVTGGGILGISSAPAAGHNIDVQGASTRLMIDNVTTDLPMASNLSVTGANCDIRVGTFGIGRWGFGGGNPYAIAGASTSSVVFSQRPTVVSATSYSTNGWFSGTRIECPLGGGHVSTSIDASGNVVVTHGFNCTPRSFAIAADAGNGAYFPIVTAWDATTITFNFYPAGSASKAVSHGVSFSWRAFF